MNNKLTEYWDQGWGTRIYLKDHKFPDTLNHNFLSNKIDCDGRLTAVHTLESFSIITYCSKCGEYIRWDGPAVFEDNNKAGFQDENRTYTEIERVMATRIDCEIGLLAVA